MRPLLYFTCFTPFPSRPASLSSLSGCIRYSLACLSSRRLDSTNLLRQPYVLVPTIYSTKPEQAALTSYPLLFLQLPFFSHRSLSLSILSGRLLPSSVGRRHTERLRQHHAQLGELSSSSSHLVSSPSHPPIPPALHLAGGHISFCRHDE